MAEAVDEETVKSGTVPLLAPATDNRPHGVVVPIPNLLLVLSQTKSLSDERLVADVQKVARLAAPLPVKADELETMQVEEIA